MAKGRSKKSTAVVIDADGVSVIGAAIESAPAPIPVPIPIPVSAPISVPEISEASSTPTPESEPALDLAAMAREAMREMRGESKERVDIIEPVEEIGKIGGPLSSTTASMDIADPVIPSSIPSSIPSPTPSLTHPYHLSISPTEILSDPDDNMCRPFGINKLNISKLAVSLLRSLLKVRVILRFRS